MRANYLFLPLFFFALCESHFVQADSCTPYSYCSRTPRYIIASSVVLGALAGAGAGYATGHVTCTKEGKCDRKCGDCPTSEVPVTLNLSPPSEDSANGPVILVTIYRPDQQVFFAGTMGQGVLPEVNDLGGEGNPTQVGKWLVSFRVVEQGTLSSDFGGIAINGQLLQTLVSTSIPPTIGEQQQIVFSYPT